jgi:type IV secretory pathway protease TraF
MIAGARTLAIMLIGVSATVSPGLADRSPWLIWNASASVPIGLYAIHTVGALRVGDLVVIKPPDRSRASSLTAVTCRVACCS